VPAARTTSASIACSAPGHCTVERAVVEQLLADPARLASDARVLPLGARGVRIDGVRPGSILDGIGLRSGDVLVAVDGVRLSSIGAIAAGYQRLRATPPDRVMVALDRGGQPETIELAIR
jgi:S1-C subfamily serine protease